MIGIILIMIGRMIEVEAEMVTVDQMIDLEIMITVIEEDNDLSIFSKMTNRKHLSYYSQLLRLRLNYIFTYLLCLD